MNADLHQEIAKILPALEIILPKESLAQLADIAPDDIYLFHFALGLFVRNNLLIPDSKLYDAFISAGIHHKDDMSAMILRLFCDYLYCFSI